MATVSADEVINYAKSVAGKTLLTLHRKAKFTVAMKGDGLTYTPASTGTNRPMPKQCLEQHCKLFSKHSSYSRMDYPKGYYHLSYTLALIDACLKQRGDPGVFRQE